MQIFDIAHAYFQQILFAPNILDTKMENTILDYNFTHNLSVFRNELMGFIDDVEPRELAVHRSGLLRRTRDPDLASIVAFTAARYKTMLAGLSIITGRRQIILSAVGTDVTETSIEDSFCAVAIQRPGEPLIVPDARADHRFATLRTVTSQPFVRFYAGVSIVDRNGYALGALCIADRTPHPELFDPTELLIRAREVERLVRW